LYSPSIELESPGFLADEMDRPATADAAPRPLSKSRLQWGAAGLIVGAALALAAIEFYSGLQAYLTARAWRQAAERASEEGNDFHASQLPSYVRGAPRKVASNQSVRALAPSGTETYTWRSLFTTYVVRVYFGLGADRSVEHVEGPLLDDSARSAL
jgi:hypothetical protein